MTTYSIKINKTKEDGTKYFVIQEHNCLDSLTKYNNKMKRYRENLRKRNLKAALEEAKYETTTVDVKHPYEIVTTKPRADHGSKTDCVFEWSKVALEAKEALKKQKAIQETHSYEKNDETFTRISYRMPKLSDLGLPKPLAKILIPSRDERIKLNHDYRCEEITKKDGIKEYKSKKEALESREFSAFHNKLYLNAFSQKTDYIKRAAEKAAHESRIKQMLSVLREKKEAVRKSKFQHRLEFRYYRGEKFTEEIKVANVIYSNKSKELLIDISKALACKLHEKSGKFVSINLYNNKTDNLIWVSTGSDKLDAYTAANRTKLECLKKLFPNYYTEAA